MYWDICRMIHQRQQHEGWGTKVIPQLSRDIRNELPEVKGFSERNIGYMIRFAREYDSHAILQQPVAKLAPDTPSTIVPQPVAQLPVHKDSENLQQLVAKIPWGHHILLMEKTKDLPDMDENTEPEAYFEEVLAQSAALAVASLHLTDAA